jgi:hypothetical protein
MGGEWDSSAYAVGSGFHASMQTCRPGYLQGGSGQGLLGFSNAARFDPKESLRDATDSIQ